MIRVSVFLALSLAIVLVNCELTRTKTGTEPGTTSPTTTTTTTSSPLTKLLSNQTTLIEDRNEPRDFGISLAVIGGIVLALLLPILLIVALVLFIPVPSFYFPAPTLLPNNGVLVTGRKLRNKFMEKLTPENMETVRGILESDVCVQRISCEIMKTSKDYNMDRWLYGIISDIPVGQTLKRKITRAAQATRNCKRFICDPLASVWKMFS